MRDTFKGQGKVWNETIEADVKHRVAEAVAGSSAETLIPERRAPFDALVKALEERLGEITSKRR
jgi:hypothetical protein